MRNIYEVNYMDDKNIDERIKNICLQAENNYILNYSKTQDDKKNKNEISEKIKMNLNQNDDMSSFLDQTMTYSKEQNDNNNFYQNKQQNEIFSNYNSNNNGYNLNNNDYDFNNIEYNSNNNEYNLNNKKYEQNIHNYNPNNNKYINNIRENEINKKTLHSRNTNTLKLNKNSNISQELINSMNNKIKYRSNNMISPKSFNDEDIVNYNSQLILSQSEINNHNHNHNGSNFFSTSSSFCFECDLQKLINDKNIYNKDLSIKAQQNKEINKIILKAKTLLVKNKLPFIVDILWKNCCG